MNRLGMGRPVYSFGLGLLYNFGAAAWQEIVRFSLKIQKMIAFPLER
jgi:hypothetical protein